MTLVVEEFGEPPLTPAQLRVLYVLYALADMDVAVTVAGRTSVEDRTVARTSFLKVRQYGLARWVTSFSQLAELTEKGKARVEVERGRSVGEAGRPR